MSVFFALLRPVRAMAILSCLVLPTTLAGCMSFGTPAASVARLASVKPLEADPGAVRFALATPEYLRLRDGDVTVTVAYDTGDPATSFVEQYKPVIVEQPADTPGIDRQALSGSRLAVAQFHESDRDAFRAMQARVKALKRGGKKGRGSLSVGATGCRTAPVPDGPLRLSAWLRIDPEEPYLLLMRDFDLRKTLRKTGADPVMIPSCN